MLEANLIKYSHEVIPGADGSQQRQSAVTAERHKMEIALAVVALKRVAHQGQNPHPRKAQGCGTRVS